MDLVCYRVISGPHGSLNENLRGMKCRVSEANFEGSLETMNSDQEIKDLFAVGYWGKWIVFLLESFVCLNSFGEQVAWKGQWLNRWLGLASVQLAAGFLGLDLLGKLRFYQPPCSLSPISSSLSPILWPSWGSPVILARICRYVCDIFTSVKIDLTSFFSIEHKLEVVFFLHISCITKVTTSFSTKLNVFLFYWGCIWMITI